VNLIKEIAIVHEGKYEITSLHNAKLLGSVRVFFVYRQLFQDNHIVGVMFFIYLKYILPFSIVNVFKIG